MNAATFKDLADGFQAIVSIGAVIIGGIWTWRAFIRRRLLFPKVNVEHVVTHRQLGKGKVVVHVVVSISNAGEVLLPVPCVFVRLQQVLPVPDEIAGKLEGTGYDDEIEIPWPMLDKKEQRWKAGDHEVEPGEVDRTEFDFLIDGDLRTIQVYTFVQNATKRDRTIGWGATTFYDFEGPHDVLPKG